MKFDIADHSELVISQRVERFESITGIETANRYTVLSVEGDELLHAREESGALGRIFLKQHRPLTLRITDSDGMEVLTASRDFFFFFSHLRVSDELGQSIGSLQRRFSFPSRKLSVQGSDGRPVAEINGPLMRPNTFMIYRQGREIGRVTKKWSGLLKEGFTDADTFKLELDSRQLGREISLLILASTFAIDLDFFESK